MKMHYFAKYWPADLHRSIWESAEKIVSSISIRWYRLYYIIISSSRNVTKNWISSPLCRGLKRKAKHLLLESSDDEELPSNAAGASAIPNNATPARLTEFNMYINTTDEIPEGQTIVQWWGVSWLSYTSCKCYSPISSRLMLIDTLFGHLSPETTSQSWHHLCRASELSLLQVLPSQSAKTA